MSKEKIFDKIIKELCEEFQIVVESKSRGWILKLQKDEKVKYIIGKKFPLNSESSGAIVSDKYATFEILDSFSVPTIKHTLLFNPKTRSEYLEVESNKEILNREFFKYKRLVIKPNFGSEGNGVTLCNSLEDSEYTVDKLFETSDSISICPYYDIKTEYRTFYLDGNVLLIYGKKKPFVVGDGISTLEELIEKLNLPKKAVVRENLRLLDLTRIPQNGEKVEISWKHNLSGGATAMLLEDGPLYEKVEKLAIRAGKAADVRFATIDIIHTNDDKLYVMEINSGVTADIFAEIVENGYEIAKAVYRGAIKAMFEM